MKTALMILFVLAAVAVANEASYRDATAMDDNYCQMVKDGTWPPYRTYLVCP